MVTGIQLLDQYFPELTGTQRQQFEQLLPIYTEWNNKINVISRKDIDQLYERHILHALAITKVAGFKPGDTVLDVGTGGGFPGIPLAIYYPETQFILVDSIAKKIKVVNEVKAAVGLTNVTAFQVRAEDVTQPVTSVVCRAVTELTPFYGWIRHKLKARGAKVYCLKGGDLQDEIFAFKSHYPHVTVREHKISDWFREPFFETKKVVELTT